MGSSGSAVARVFTVRPDRLAAAWRRVRAASRPSRSLGQNQLDGVVDAFIREIGHQLAGVEGSPWSRCRGVLRLSLARGLKSPDSPFTIHLNIGADL